MKRFTICLMLVLLILTLIAVLLSPAHGQEVRYPPEVYSMTDAQFEQWANKVNAERITEWKAKKEAAKKDQSQYLEGTSVRADIDYREGFNATNGVGGNTFVAGNNVGQITGSGGNDYYGERHVNHRIIPILVDNPKYVNPGPLTLLNPFCPPRKWTAAEQAAMKKAYDEAEGRVMTIKSGEGTLHIKVSPANIPGWDEKTGFWKTN